jgi:O-antigen chain-terminating methyltransferase
MNQQDFYRAFEDRHRGSRDLIKARLNAYAPFVQPLLGLASGHGVLDLGCGRGEWLELIREWGFEPRGIDSSDSMLAACREMGLDTERGDALDVLRGTPDESLVLVSAFHLVEHLPFDDVRTLIAEAHRVLRPGGLLIVETPNPENLVVATSSFYLDPSHKRPLPPLLLEFASQFAGFVRNKVVRLQEPDRSGRPVHLIDVLGGASPDYGVVAQKKAPAEVLARFEPAFATTFGTTLAALALQYDEQLETRLNSQRVVLEAQAEHAELRAQQAELRARKAELRVEEADLQKARAEVDAREATTRAKRAEARVEQPAKRVRELEERVEHSAARVDAILASTSWPLSAPIRWAGAPVARITAAIREGRIKSGAKRRIKVVLRHAAQAVLRRPVLSRVAHRCLDLAPGLRARLSAALAPHAAAGSRAATLGGQLELLDVPPSTEARQILRRLLSNERLQGSSQ